MVVAQETLIDELAAILCEEAAHHAGLWRRTVRAQRYMVRRDSRRLMATSEELSEQVPRARALASRREALVQLLAQRLGRPEVGAQIGDLLEHLEPAERASLEPNYRALASTAELLYRANVQNHQLASYSVDLVREEMRILSGGSPNDGAYDGGGERREAAAASSLMDGRA